MKESNCRTQGTQAKAIYPVVISCASRKKGASNNFLIFTYFQAFSVKSFSIRH